MKLDPDWRVTLKFVGFTVIDSILAVEPETSSSIPFTLKTVLVVSCTVSKAANANAGAKSATRIPAPVSIRGIVSFN